VYRVVAEKVAVFHSLDMPIDKSHMYLEAFMARVIKDFESSPVSIEEIDAEERESAKYLRDFPYEQESYWIKSIMPKLGSTVVCCHNDLQRLNIVKRTDKETLEEKLMILDYETICYHYRGFELGYYFRSWTQDWRHNKSPFIGNSFPDETIRRDFIRIYLSKLRELRPELVNDRDSEEQLLMEIDFFAFIADFYITGFFVTWSWGNKSPISLVLLISFNPNSNNI